MSKNAVNAALVIASVLSSLIVLEAGFRLRAYKEGWAYQLMNFRNRALEIASSKTNNPAAFDAELGWVPKEGVWKDTAGQGPEVTILKDGIRSVG